jgi:sulfide:quinone oxidoreductase
MWAKISAMTEIVKPAPGSSRQVPRSQARVVIAGAGVAGLEAVLALRALAGDRIDIVLVAPDARFINRSMAVEKPFRYRRVRGVRTQDIADEFGAQWHRGALDRVEHERRVVITKDGGDVPYDMLLLALGAHPEREWDPGGPLIVQDDRDEGDYRLLLYQLREGRVNQLAFVKPAGPSWPLPLYDLVLMTAADCVAHGRSGVELSLITPEQAPLGIFGSRVSADVRRLLAEAGVALHTSSAAALHPSSFGARTRRTWLEIRPGGRRLSVDRIITEPRLVGPRLRGVPCDGDGFISTDLHGRVPGMDGVFAAGDATTFPIKQGGLAAQQADAVAEAIACAVGIDIDPKPFRPVLRGVLLTGAAPHFLRADISGCAGDDSTISREPLWWPPNRLCGRYLAPYLSRQTGDAADVMAQEQDGLPVGVTVDHGGALADIPLSPR